MSEERKRHPIRGLIFGLLLGLGVALLAISYSFAPFGSATLLALIGLGALIGLLIGLFAPAKQVEPKT